MSDTYTMRLDELEAKGGVISVPVLPAGKFASRKHRYAKSFSVDKARLERMAANANANVTGTGVFLDLSENHSKGESGGWMVPGSAKVAPFTDSKTGKQVDGLWMDFELNDLGKPVIADKRKRFLSIDSDTYADESTGKTYKDVPFAVLLTNKPIIKSLPPVDAALQCAEDDEDGDTLVLSEDVADILDVPSQVEAYLEGKGLALAEMTASVGGEQHPCGDFAYCPDPNKPSTWKFPIYDKAHAAAAAARMNQSDIPPADLPAVKRKVAAAHRKFFPGEPMPDSLKLSEDPPKGVTHVEEDDKGLKLAEAEEALKAANERIAAAEAVEAERTASIKAAEDRLAALELAEITKGIRALPVDAPTQERLVRLATVTHGSESLCLAEGEASVSLISEVMDIVAHAKPVHDTGVMKPSGYVEVPKAADGDPLPENGQGGLVLSESEYALVKAAYGESD